MGKKKGSKGIRQSRKWLIGLVAVVLIVVVVAFALNYVTSDSGIVKITRFAKTGEGSVPDQVIYQFSVTIENQGRNDVSGLVLTVKILGNGTEIQREAFSLQTIRHGQAYSDDQVRMLVDLNKTAGNTIGFSATLSLNSMTIDEVMAS